MKRLRVFKNRVLKKKVQGGCSRRLDKIVYRGASCIVLLFEMLFG